MSYGIFAHRAKQLFLNTYSTTRESKILYFDGGSAVLVSGGTDAQDVILHGKVPTWDAQLQDDSGDDDGEKGRGPGGYDYTRAKELCEWGGKFGVEGFVRMNSGL